MNRREFLGGFALASGSIFAETSSADQIELFSQKFGLSILQGFTDETSTQFSVDVIKNKKLIYEVIDPQTGRVFYPDHIESSSRGYSLYRVDKVIFKNLYLNSGFELLVKDHKKNILDQRSFKMLDTQKPNARIALLSCMLDLSPARNEMWKLVEASQPDIIFLLGDNVYGDIKAYVHGPSFLWMRYIQTRRSLRLYHQRQLVPSIAIWDDHDYGRNDTGGEYKHKENSLSVFNSFYAQTPVGSAYKKGPGVASSFTAFGQKFIFLDCRYWRGLANRFSSTGYLGEEQMDWFAQELQHSEHKTWIFQGSQFFSEYEKSSGTYEQSSPEELRYFTDLVRSHDKPTFFGSGDVHFSEVIEAPRNLLGFQAYELTSSCLHSMTEKKLYKSDRRVAGALKENFIMVDTTPDNETLVTSLGKGRKTNFSIIL